MIRMMSLDEAIALLGSPEWSDINTFVEILKTNFRKLILKFHTDKDKSQEEIGKKIIEAYSVIKDALEKGDLNLWLQSHIKDSEKKFEDQTLKENCFSWNDLEKEVNSVTETVVSNLGSMRELLMSMPEGEHYLVFRNLRFKVKCISTGRTTHKGEEERVWTVFTKTIENIEAFEIQENPFQLIFQ